MASNSDHCRAIWLVLYHKEPFWPLAEDVHVRKASGQTMYATLSEGPPGPSAQMRDIDGDRRHVADFRVKICAVRGGNSARHQPQVVAVTDRVRVAPSDRTRCCSSATKTADNKSNVVACFNASVLHQCNPLGQTTARNSCARRQKISAEVVKATSKAVTLTVAVVCHPAL